MRDSEGHADTSRGPTAEQVYRAALAVCSRSETREDAEEMLDALGLLDHGVLTAARRRARRRHVATG